jgi:hypothetical protein
VDQVRDQVWMRGGSGVDQRGSGVDQVCQV